MTELEMRGERDPYLEERNRAAAAGANVLLVRSRVLQPRRNINCPAAAPITDCPPSTGAWYRVAFESYACPPEVEQKLKAPPAGDAR